MPGKNGLQFLEELKKNSMDIPFILFTGKGREEVAVKALNLGAYRYLNKHGEPETVYTELASSIQQAADHAQSELILKNSEERFRQVAENSQIWIWEVDAKGLYTYASPAVEKMLGFKPEEIVGKKYFYDFFVPSEKEENREAAFNVFAQKQHFRDFIKVNVHKNGKLVCLSTSGLPFMDERGNLVGYRGTDEDITERKEAEQKLVESEEKYRDIVENAQDAIYVHDLKGKVISINKYVEEYGYAPDQLIGKNMLKFIPKKYWPKIIAQLSQLATGKRVKGEIEVKTPLGMRSAEYRSNPVRRGNKVVAVQSILRDTTDRKKTEEALLESQQKFKALFDANPEAAVFLDSAFRVVEANARFTKLFGYSFDEIKGKVITDVIVPEEMQEESKILRKNIINGPVEVVASRLRKDGTKVPLMLCGGPVMVDDKAIGSVMVYKDISEIITVQEELGKALNKAEVLNEKLSIVGGFTRYDVRNKLTTIKGNLYLANKYAGDNERLKACLSQMNLAIDNVTRILGFAKDFEMLGSQDLSITDVGKAVDEASSLFADLKGTKIINECRGLNVMADSMLTTIFHNLIDNSLKYGKKLTKIRVYCKPQNKPTAIVYEDDGIGIDTQIKKQLFNKGVGRGTGYGLYLIKRTCEVYGWTVKETGHIGKGARFEFTIKPKHK